MPVVHSACCQHHSSVLLPLPLPLLIVFAQAGSCSLNGDVQFSGSAGMTPHALLSVDLGSGQWTNESATLPSGLAVTHFGAAVAGGRYLYIVAGQVSE